MAFSNHSIWSGFYKKAIKERQAQLKLVFPDLFSPSNLSGSSLSITNINGQLPRSASTQLIKDQLSVHTNINGDDGSVSLAAQSGLRSSLSVAKSLDDLTRMTRSSSSETNTGVLEELFPVRGLDEQIADNMIEVGLLFQSAVEEARC